MGDQGMDPCECIWGHEMAMRRLLNILRNSQALCTDSQCYEDGTPSPQTGDSLLLMTVMFVVAMVWFYYRPRPQRISEDPEKPKNSGNDPHGSPPTPPPTTS